MAEVLQRNAEVGERLRELRNARRLTQPKAADAVGVTLRAYQAWESGENAVSWPNLERLAEVFKVSPEYLQHGQGVINPAHATTQLDRIEAALGAIAESLDGLTKRLGRLELEQELARTAASKKPPARSSAARTPRRRKVDPG